MKFNRRFKQCQKEKKREQSQKILERRQRTTLNLQTSRQRRSEFSRKNLQLNETKEDLSASMRQMLRELNLNNRSILEVRTATRDSYMRMKTLSQHHRKLLCRSIYSMNKSTLLILQYNVNKYREQVMISLMIDENSWEYDIIAIQKSWNNFFQIITYHLLKNRFDLIYREEWEIRVCFFVNNRLRESWIYSYHSKNLCSIHLDTEDELHTQKIHIHNIYNSISLSSEDRQSTLSSLQRALKKNQNEKHLILSSFNLHHSMCEDNQIRESLSNAEKLLEIVTDFQLKLLLSIDIKIKQKREESSTIDLVFDARLLADFVINCELFDKKMNHDSDHISITTLTTIIFLIQTSRVWHQLKKKNFKREIEKSLQEFSDSWDEKVFSSSMNFEVVSEKYSRHQRLSQFSF